MHSLISRHINADTLVSSTMSATNFNAGTGTEANALAMHIVPIDGTDTNVWDDITPKDNIQERVTYVKSRSAYSYDKLVFHFKLPSPLFSDALIPGTGGSYEGNKVYAVARIEVVDGPDEGTNPDVYFLDNRDTQTRITTASISSDVVGDGSTAQLDNVPPSSNLISVIDVTLNGDYLRADYNPDATSNADATPTTPAITTTPTRVGVGGTIDIEITGNSAHRIRSFREEDVIIHLIGTEAVGTNTAVPADDPLYLAKGKKWESIHPSRDVLRGTGLVTTRIKVEAGQFKRNPAKAATAVQSEGRGKLTKNNPFEDDNMVVKVQVTVKDKAGNTTVQDPDGITSSANDALRFILDSKLPKVSILYPKTGAKKDSTRFTAHMQQEYEFIGDNQSSAVPLNPLHYAVDEETQKQVVYINEDSLVIDSVTPSSEPTTLLAALKNKGFDRNGTKYSLVEDKEGVYVIPAGLKKHSQKSNAKLRVYATDLTGNRSVDGKPAADKVVFDADPPQITGLFPNNDVLAQYGNIINDDTKNPSFKINEEVDSLLIRYQDLVNNGNSRNKAGTVAHMKMVNKTIEIPFAGADSLIHEDIYDLQIYARDLAGNIGVSTVSKELTYDKNFKNPAAGAFKIVAEVRDNKKGKNAQSDADYAKPSKAKMDSIVAGQALRLTITALDEALTKQAGEDRPAVVYKQADVVVKAQDAMGNLLSDVTFWGDGVTPAKGGGSATLDGANWFVGEREVFLAGTVAQTVTIVVADMTDDNMDNHFSKSYTIVVDAADFQSLMITAMDDGVEGVETVWGEFELTVVPTDKYGNPSLKVFLGSDAPKTGGADSLNILDTRIKAANNTHEYERIYVELEPNYSLDGFSTRGRPVYLKGRTYFIEAPERSGRILEFDASVDDRGLDDDDERSEKVTNFVEFDIRAPLMIAIGVADSDGNAVTGDVQISQR